MGWQNLLLKLELERTGRVMGECRIEDPEYKGCIEVESLAFDISTPGDPLHQDRKEIDPTRGLRTQLQRQIATRSVSRASLSNLTLTKPFDTSSTALFKALGSQELIKKAVFYALRRKGEHSSKLKPSLWMQITLADATVQKIDLNLASAANNTAVSEDVKLRFRTISVTYSPESGAGFTEFSHAQLLL